MDELTGPEIVDVMSLTLPMEVTTDDLAVALVHGKTSAGQLLELISSIDSEVGDWSFTLDLARWLVPLLIEYANDEDDSTLINAVKVLMKQLDQIKS